jgi:GTP cyclohydrolase II
MTVRFVASALLPTQWGDFELLGFLDESSGKEHLVIAKGLNEAPAPDKVPLLRIHSECLTGDALFSLRCDCGSQLKNAMQKIAQEGCGAVLYLRQEGRGIGLLNKIKAYHLQDEGADTVEANEQLGFHADQRDYAMCEPMLKHLHITQLRLLTNNPQKVIALEKMGIKVVERIPLRTGQNSHNERYLQTKKGKLGHLME